MLLDYNYNRLIIGNFHKRNEKMLMFVFFSAVFSSACWLIYAVMFILSKLADSSLWQQTPEQLLIMLAIAFLPVLAIWVAFGFINQFASTRAMNAKQTELLKQLQKNQDYTDLVVRVMLDAEHEIKDGFVINKFDMFIADMNESLGEIIQRCNIASSAQLEQLWQRVRRGEKWTLGKAVIDASKSQSTFNAWVREKVNRDKVFRGTLLEFCSRYQNLLQLLEKHDRDRVFLKIVETGVFGKVYSIIAPLSEGISPAEKQESVRENKIEPAKRTSVNDYSSVLKLATMEEPTASETIVNVDKNDEDSVADDENFAEKKPSFFSRLNPFKRKEEDNAEEEQEQDPFFQALHDSLQGGNGLTASRDENVSVSLSPEPLVVPMEDEPLRELSATLGTEPQISLKSSFGSVQDTLNSLRSSNETLEKNVKEPTIADYLKDEPHLSVPVAEVAAKPEERLGSIASSHISLRKEESLAAANKIISVMNRQVESSVRDDKKEDKEDVAYPFGGWTDEDNYRK